MFQSSDYRSEDSYSKNDDYDYADRKYRNKDYRDRDRTSRSRSRSFERDNRNYDYDSGKNYDKYDDKERFYPKEKKEVPNNTLMIRNLPLHFTDKDVRSHN